MTKDELLYSSFRARINSCDFKKLIEDYKNIDKEIGSCIYAICCDHLKQIGAIERNEKYLFSDGEFLTVDVPLIDSTGRTITIYFLSSNTNELSPVNKNYSFFGTLRRTVIFYPNRLAPSIRQLLERICNFIGLAYTLWEKIYITKFNEWSYKRKKILLNGIYDLIETEIARNNPRFKNKVWLSVIQLDKGGESGDFVFEFTESFLTELISDLKKNRSLQFSPMLIISNLITKNVIDEQTGMYKDGIFTFQTSVENLKIQFDDETYLFWIGSKLLYTNKMGIGMGCHTIAEEAPFLLSVDHSAYNYETAIKIIEPIKDQIIEMFGQNVLEYKKSPISKITLKLAVGVQSKLIPATGRIKDVFIEKSIEQLAWEPVKNGLKLLIEHLFKL